VKCRTTSTSLSSGIPAMSSRSRAPRRSRSPGRAGVSSGGRVVAAPARRTEFEQKPLIQLMCELVRLTASPPRAHRSAHAGRFRYTHENAVLRVRDRNVRRMTGYDVRLIAFFYAVDAPCSWTTNSLNAPPETDLCGVCPESVERRNRFSGGSAPQVSRSPLGRASPGRLCHERA